MTGSAMNDAAAAPRSPPLTIRVALALAAATLVAACGKDAPVTQPDPGPSISGTNVRFAGRVQGLRIELVQDEGTTAVTLPGRLAWDEDRTVRVSSPFAGRVLRPLVQVGDTVRAGQPLAELASGEFGQAIADARRAEADLRLADDALARQRELNEAGLVALKDVRQAEADQSRAAIEVQRAQTRLAQMGPPSGPNFMLRAPIAGVIVERTLNPGQELRPDQGGALFTITDPARLWAWLDAPESLLPVLAPLPPGTPLTLRSTAWGARAFEARLVRKEDAIDPVARTFRLRAAVSNPERALKAEMYVSATLSPPGEPAERTVEHVPSAAVLLIDGRHAVFVQDGEASFTRVDVRVVRELPGRIAVTGLNPGQRVVVDGVLFLQQILSRHGDAPAAPAAAVHPVRDGAR